MKILIATNTFTPHVGGVARSVEAFAGEYRHRGHQVLVLAPEFPDMPADEADVIRIPAINGERVTRGRRRQRAWPSGAKGQSSSSRRWVIRIWAGSGM